MISSQDRGKLFYSLRSWMVLYFGALFAVSLVILKIGDTFGIPFTSYNGEYGHARDGVLRSLNLVADIKKERLQGWLVERKGDARVLADSIDDGGLAGLLDFFRARVEGGSSDDDLLKAMEAEPLYREMLRGFETLLVYGAYKNIELADKKTGRVMVSINRTLVGMDVSKTPHFMETLSATKDETIHAEIDPRTGEADILFCVPVRIGGQTVADLSLRVSLEKVVKPLLQTGSGLGLTGEVLLVDQDATLLTPLDNIPSDIATSAKPLVYRISALPAKLAAQGKEGIVESLDYRGVPVIAASRFIPIDEKHGWGMVVKRDRGEVYAPLWRGITYALAVSALCLALTLAVTLIVSGRLARPVRLISEAASRIEAGDLSARAPITGHDEIDALAETFNSMAERVQNWRAELESEVRRRTLELEEEIKERKLAMSKLAESERRFRETIENVNLIALQLDDSGAVTFANDFLLSLTGWKREEVAGKNWFDLFLPLEARAEVKNVFADLMKDGKLRPHHINQIITKNGERRTVSWNNTITRSLDGGINGVTSIGEDITERERIERERESLIAALEAKNAELERFTYTVSHDLKSPLITIKGFAGQIERDISAGDPARLRSDLSRIIAATDMMQRLLSELLELSRIGRLVNPPVRVSMKDLAEKARELLAGSVEARGVKVVIAGEMPAVFGDYPRLLEVTQNLLDNAVKFMGDQPYPVVEIGSKNEGNETVFYVKDNGIGIDRKYHEKIFGLFDKLEKQTEGTGIGLALVKKIVEAHGGRIWVESAGLGYGACFLFTIPDGRQTAQGGKQP